MTTNNRNGINTANLLFEATQYFVNNLNAGLNKLEEQYRKIDTKINTPPRNEELEAGQKLMDEKLDRVVTLLESLKTTFKTTLLYIKIFATAISMAIIVGGIMIYYGNHTMNIDKLEVRLERIEKHIEQTEKRLELLEKTYIKLSHDELDK